MKLQDIGFYTLCDERVAGLSPTSPMWRCEMILTERCNFNCPYCRGLRDDCLGDMPYGKAILTLNTWCNEGLKNVRFSGGEPMLYKDLPGLVEFCKARGVERIAISTNGSFPLKKYLELVELGANDFSISFDACCASECGKMCGKAAKMFERICNSIRELSKVTYVTVGVVLTDDNADNLVGIVQMAHDLGVADIRIIPAAQNGNMVKGVQTLPESLLEHHPILAYRVKNMLAGDPVRGHRNVDSDRCYIPVDDSVVCGRYHFPCVIYMREHGKPIGVVGPDMRAERIEWAKNHRPKSDPICCKNCLDVCIDHNNKCYDLDLNTVKTSPLCG
jgi:molybdenum cofactor biosynthesis enzyme MoaA